MKNLTHSLLMATVSSSVRTVKPSPRAIDLPPSAFLCVNVQTNH